MSEQERLNEDVEQVLVIRSRPQRATELDRLAQQAKKDPGELAKEFLETEA